MEAIRLTKNVIHAGQPKKAGHIFKIPDDMDLETARRLVDKDIATDSIEVLEEVEAALGETVELVSDEGSDPDVAGSEEEINTDEPDAGDSDDSGADTPEVGDPDEDAEEEEAININDLKRGELMEELKARGIDYKVIESNNSLRDKLREVLASEAGNTDSEDSEEG